MESGFPAHESIRKRRRWGCTCGCLAVVVAVAFGTIALAYYVFSPKPSSTEDRWLQSSNDGFAIIRLNQADEGISDMTEFVMRRFEAQQKQGKPENDQKAISAAMKAARQFAGTFFHPQNFVYLTYTPGAGEGLLIVSQSKNNIARILLQLYAAKAGVKPSDTYKGQDIYSFPEKPSAGTSGTLVTPSSGAVLVSNDQGLMRQGIEASSDAKHRGQASAELQQFIDELALSQPPVGEDFSMAVVNEENRIRNSLLAFEKHVGLAGLTDNLTSLLEAQKTGFQDLSGIRLSGDIESAERAKLQITFYCRQSDVAKKFNEAVLGVLAHLATPENKEQKLTIKGDSKVRGTSVVADLEITGLKAWVESIIPLKPAKQDS